MTAAEGMPAPKTENDVSFQSGKQDADKMMKDMTAIVNWVEKLKEVNTDGVEPLTTMSHEVNVLREDEVKEHLSHDLALKNAPKKDADYFRVPKVLE